MYVNPYCGKHRTTGFLIDPSNISLDSLSLCRHLLYQMWEICYGFTDGQSSVVCNKNRKNKNILLNRLPSNTFAFLLLSLCIR